MAIKILAVVVVVGAFNFIRLIEARKRGYDEAYNRPIIIVDDPFWTDCEESLKMSPMPSPSPVSVHAICGDARLIAASSIQNKLVPDKDLIELVDKIKYQNFQSESDILQRLDAEILTAADYFKRVTLTTLESERKSLLNKQAELKQDEEPVTDKLKAIYEKKKADSDRRNKDPKKLFQEFTAWRAEKSALAAYPTDEMVAKWRLKLYSTEVASGRRTKSSVLKEDELLSWYRKITTTSPDTKLEFFNNKIQAVDVDARNKIKLIYEKLNPELPSLVSNALFSQPREDGFRARFNPTGIYDEKSGSHVVYQTLWMTCAMVLVFGVLFGVFLILRLLPGVANGMEVLKGHAGDLFSHAGMAIPQAGKSLLVGVATLGVGAAVAVGGTAAVSQLHLVETESIRGADGKTGERGKTGDPGNPGALGKPGERGSDGKSSEPFTGTLTVQLQGPIALSSPITVNGPETVTLNTDSLQALKDYITQLSDPAFSTKITTQMTEVATKIVEDKIKTIDTESLDKRLRELENQKLESRVTVLELSLSSFPATLGNQLAQSLSPLKDEMTATRLAIERLNMQPGSGSQGLFPRLKGAFKGDKYLMTYQSLTSLGLLIRMSADQSCKQSVASSVPCCPSASPIATCPDDLIFSSLAGMLGEPPLDENAFWNKLKEIWNEKMKKVAQGKKPTKIDDWRVVILRQTRIAY